MDWPIQCINLHLFDTVRAIYCVNRFSQHAYVIFAVLHSFFFFTMQRCHSHVLVGQLKCSVRLISVIFMMPVTFLPRPIYLHHDPWKWGIICQMPAPALTDGKTPTVLNGILGSVLLRVADYLPLFSYSNMQESKAQCLHTCL